MRFKLYLSLGVFLLGCGASRDQAYTAKAEPSAATVDEALLTQAEELWGQREDVAKLKEALATYEQVAAQQPDNRDVLTRLARGNYLLAYGYLTNEEEVLAAYDKGASWGERILGLRPEFRDRIAAGEQDYEILDITQKEDAPGIYWAYSNLGKWSVAKGFTTVVKNKSKLKAFIDKVVLLDPEYYHAAADRGLGAYYAKAPSFAGGDLNKAKEHFDKSLELAPGYFGTKVLIAEYYAVKMQDRELFEKLLNEVINGDANAMPDVVPIQKVDQRRAKELLAKAVDLFE